MTAPIIAFGGSFDDGGIQRGAARAKGALVQVDKQALRARQQFKQLGSQTTGAFTTMAVAAGGMNTTMGTLATSFASLSVASGPIALTALAVTGIVAAVTKWRDRQKEVTAELRKTSEQAQAAAARILESQPDFRVGNLSVQANALQADLDKVRGEMQSLQGQTLRIAGIRTAAGRKMLKLQEQEHRLASDINVLERERNRIIEQRAAAADRAAMAQAQSVAAAGLPSLAERAFTGDSPFGLQAAANRVGLGGDRIATTDVRDSSGRIVKQTTAMVRFNQEAEKMIKSLRQAANKEIPLFGQAIVATLGSALGSLVGGGGGRGFLGSLFGGLGSIASLVPGIGTLASGAIGVGGGLIQSLLNKPNEPAHVVVDEFGPRAQSQQRSSPSFTNVILNANSSIEEIDRAIRRLQGRDGLQRIGAGGVGG